AAGGLDGKEPAGLHRHAVEEDRARSAGRGVAADLRAGQPQEVAQVVDEEQTRLNVRFDRLAVDPQRDVHGRWFPPAADRIRLSASQRPERPLRRHGGGPEWAYASTVRFVLEWTVVSGRRII